ncbi:hypothetical protein G6O67_006751 [Ophiocordyceps sinensis]|uniref:LysM domain-containing protein n=1 Tax=Ophiocordyceps sinensis TaxID=72228 RepID=A0A8H4PN29_9HYPO|nr:hypothetical protein G6O67_006751 [Ophiocordyceps sinensis]
MTPLECIMVLLAMAHAAVASPRRIETKECTALPQPLHPGVAIDCNTYYRVRPGDNCNGIAQEYGIATMQFIIWNLGVGARCTTLQPGFYACVSVVRKVIGFNPYAGH